MLQSFWLGLAIIFVRTKGKMSNQELFDLLRLIVSLGYDLVHHIIQWHWYLRASIVPALWCLPDDILQVIILLFNLLCGGLCLLMLTYWSSLHDAVNAPVRNLHNFFYFSTRILIKPCSCNPRTYCNLSLTHLQHRISNRGVRPRSTLEQSYRSLGQLPAAMKGM